MRMIYRWFWYLTVVMLAAFVGCDTKSKADAADKTQAMEASFTEQQQQTLVKVVSPPKLSFSLERTNLKERLVRFNDPNKVSYIYLINFGKVMGFYPIKGKVSSVNSKLTTGEQVVYDPFCDSYGGAVSCGKTVESPQLDGSYGTNGDAIFFFTTENVYVEWKGDYMLVDQPLQMATPPALIYTKNIDGPKAPAEKP